MHPRVLFILFVIPALVAMASLGHPTATHAQTQPDWLVAINNVRTAAGLPAVTEDTASSAGGRDHSLYVVRHNMLGHTEDPNAAGFTTDGAQAGQTGDVEGQFGGGAPTAADLVSSFMTGAYHWEPLLDASLTSVGFGSATFQDVFPGQTPAPGAITAAETIVFNRPFAKPPRPILWPPNSGTMPFTTFNGEETPSALVNCAGYTAPTGPSLSLQLPATPQVTAATLTEVGIQGNLDSCWFTNATVQFSANDQAWVSVGHNILSNANAVVIFPKQPLTAGTYCVSVTNSGTPINWSFTVGTAPVAPPPPCGQNTGLAANPPATTTNTTTNTPTTPTTTTNTTTNTPTTPTTTTNTTTNTPTTPATTTNTTTNTPTTPTTTTNTTTNTPTTPTTTTNTTTNTPTTPATTTTPTTTTNPTTAPNAQPQPVATPGWTGTWNTDFGTLTLTQNGNQVSGAFQDQTNTPGTITGTATGPALNATWDLAPSTPGLVTVALAITESTDGSSFTGTYDLGGGDTGTWSGTRAGP